MGGAITVVGGAITVVGGAITVVGGADTVVGSSTSGMPSPFVSRWDALVGAAMFGSSVPHLAQ